MKTISVIAVTLAFTLNLFSQNAPLKGDDFSLQVKKDEVIKIDNLISPKGSTLNKNELTGYSYQDSKLNIYNFKHSFQETPKKKKKVWLGAVLSALLPGAGEFYGENYLKAAIFFGVEVLAWGTFTYFTLKGDDKTDAFQKYANENWDIHQYGRWLNEEWEQSGVNWQETNLDILRAQVIAAEQEIGFSHSLPELYSQQYYELIGKYQPYVAGWKDARDASGNWLITQQNVESYQTAMFKSYSADRGDANDMYNYAKIGPITAILNHILSAADAAWTISTYNKKIKVETGFRMGNYVSPYTYKIEMQPTFNMRVSF